MSQLTGSYRRFFVRSYRFTYPDQFKTGLVNESPNSVNNVGFVKLVNMYPWANSLNYRDRFNTLEVAEPSCQMFQIGLNTYLVSATKVYRVSESGKLTLVHTLSTPSVRPWSWADFAKFGILTNGVTDLFVNETGAVSTVKPFAAQLPHANSMLSLGGQVILGGIVDGWNNLDDTYVAWSKIGGVDFTVDKTNEAGFHCPNIGHVYSVLQCNRSFMALGSEGVAVYSPAEQTFSFTKLFNIGIKDKGYAVSSEQDVYFIDTLGFLRKIGFTQAIDRTSHSVQLIGFSWLFEGRGCKMHWCDGENELRIVVNNSQTFLMNQYGMYSTNLVILGQQMVGDRILCAVFGDQIMADAYFETSNENAEISGLKSITEVYVNDSSPCTKFISIKSIKGSQVFSSREYRVSQLGIVAPNIACDVYRIGYRVPNYLDEDSALNTVCITDYAVQTVKIDGRFGRGYLPGQMPTGG